jgi:hypothetical protein
LRGLLLTPSYPVWMPYLYGDRITEVESADLLARLRARGSAEATMAAETIRPGVRRDATHGTSEQVQAAILVELLDWDNLTPGLAVVRDRLSGPQRGLRII